jgi:GNAT superfamily N-acetyltransferase
VREPNTKEIIAFAITSSDGVDPFKWLDSPERIHLIYTAFQHRRKGLAKTILSQIKEDHSEITSICENPESLRLHQKLGFGHRAIVLDSLAMQFPPPPKSLQLMKFRTAEEMEAYMSQV